MKKIEGVLNSAGFKFSLVAGRFNRFITDNLIEGARDCLVRHGASEDDISLYMTPGSFEIPQVCAALSESAGTDAVVALGALIRGDTIHFDLLANQVARALSEISVHSRIPIVFGILTADTIEQAVERAGIKAGNKGWDAALAAIEMVNLNKELGRRIDAPKD
jgi:6,7-dimethyl-8-ribityllumazine synthase